MHLLGVHFVEFSVQLRKGSACCLIDKYLSNYSDMKMDKTVIITSVCVPNIHIVISINNSVC